MRHRDPGEDCSRQRNSECKDPVMERVHACGTEGRLVGLEQMRGRDAGDQVGGGAIRTLTTEGCVSQDNSFYSSEV